MFVFQHSNGVAINYSFGGTCKDPQKTKQKKKRGPTVEGTPATKLGLGLQLEMTL